MWHKLGILTSHGKLLLYSESHAESKFLLLSSAWRQNVPITHYVESATLPGFKFFAEVSVLTPISHRSKGISSVSAPASTPPAPVH